MDLRFDLFGNSEMTLIKLLVLCLQLAGLSALQSHDSSTNTDAVSRSLLKAMFAMSNSENVVHHRQSRSSTKRRKNEPCCENGGLCVLGSFCHCPENYYGRRCEHKVSRRNCGSVPHDEWFIDMCNLCHCSDGVLMCLPHIVECGEKKEAKDPSEFEAQITDFREDIPSGEASFSDEIGSGDSQWDDTSSSCTLVPSSVLLVITISLIMSKLIDL